MEPRKKTSKLAPKMESWGLKERKMRNAVLKTFAIILFISVLIPLGHAHGKELLSGNELVQLMREYEKAERNAKTTDWRKAGEYRGYVMGFYDATWFFYADPENITSGRVAAVVAAFLKQHPEKWDRPAWDLVMEALQEAFPKAK
jgi:hypothetical protein